VHDIDEVQLIESNAEPNWEPKVEPSAISRTDVSLHDVGSPVTTMGCPLPSYPIPVHEICVTHEIANNPFPDDGTPEI
jgi:hypothetical protein